MGFSIRFVTVAIAMGVAFAAGTTSSAAMSDKKAIKECRKEFGNPKKMHRTRMQPQIDACVAQKTGR